ncbi:MAG TPA: hypothetical protein VI589_06950 [Vicinamibacteria bacterium]
MATKKAKAAPRKWITVEAAVHVWNRRIGKLLPLRVEPGRKLLAGARTTIRKVDYVVRGFGYEYGSPVVHLGKVQYGSPVVHLGKVQR